jgi:hypothetical protein
VSFDPVTDCLTVEGIRYDGQMFRNVARWAIGSQYRIIKREDGIVTMARITGGRRAG